MHVGLINFTTRNFLILGVTLFLAISQPAKASEPHGLLSLDKPELLREIPKTVVDAPVYRLGMLTEKPLWASKQDYLSRETKGDFLGSVLRELRESCEKGEFTSGDPLYESLHPTFPDITEEMADKKCQMEKLPYFFSSISSGFPAIKKNLLITTRHSFESDLKLVAIDTTLKTFFTELKKEFSKLDPIFPPWDQDKEAWRTVAKSAAQKRAVEEGWAAIQTLPKVKGFFTKIESFEKFLNSTPNNPALKDLLDIYQKATAKYLLEEENKHTKIILLRHQIASLLERAWNIPLNFILFDRDGDIIFYPDPKKNQSSKAKFFTSSGTLAAIDALRLPKRNDESFVALQEELEKENGSLEKFLIQLLDTAHDVMVIELKGAAMGEPLNLGGFRLKDNNRLFYTEDDLSKKLYAKGYPRVTTDKADSGSVPNGEYVSVGTLKSLVSEPPLEEKFKFLTPLVLCTSNQVVSGMSGGPILNEKGSVVGIITATVPPKNGSEGDTCWGSTSFFLTANLQVAVDLKEQMGAMKRALPKAWYDEEKAQSLEKSIDDIISSANREVEELPPPAEGQGPKKRKIVMP